MQPTGHASSAASRLTTLSDATVERLKDLVRVNLDSSRGFETTADQVESAPVADLMRSIASERRGFANDLRQQVRFNL